jgi:integrase
MPRKSKGARLAYSDDDGYWYIRDGQRRRSTGCTFPDKSGAEQKLKDYLAQKHEPHFGSGDPAKVSVIDIMLLYVEKKAPLTRRPDIVDGAKVPLGLFWKGKSADDITPNSCQSYVNWRCSQRSARHKVDPENAPFVSISTARRELEVLSAAIGFAYKERKLKYVVPVALPQKSNPRDRWLTRSEVARLVWAAWRMEQGRSKHVARFILLGLYTGTRHEAMLRLKWLPSIDSGYIDLKRRIIYRRGKEELESNKRRTPVPISDRLLPHLKRWKRTALSHVIEYDQEPIQRIKRAWQTARKEAGLGPDVTPHVLRHTFATWAVQDGVELEKVAAALGTTKAVVERVYGHHAPERLRDVVNTVGRRRD